MQPRRRTVAAVLFWSLSMPWSVAAQDAVPNRLRAPNAAHRFFDGLNVGLTVMESGALLADGFTTQYALTHVPNSREADPLARPFVSRGWPGQIAGGALVVTADVGIRYWLHRSNHHRIERWMPLILTVYGSGGAIHNWREIHRSSR